MPTTEQVLKQLNQQGIKNINENINKLKVKNINIK